MSISGEQTDLEPVQVKLFKIFAVRNVSVKLKQLSLHMVEYRHVYSLLFTGFDRLKVLRTVLISQEQQLRAQ